MSMAATNYVSRDGQIKVMGTFLSTDGMAFGISVDFGRFPHLMLEKNRRKTESPSVIITAPAVVNVIIYFQCMSVSSERLQKKMLAVLQTYHTGMLMGLYARRFLNAWKEL